MTLDSVKLVVALFGVVCLLTCKVEASYCETGWFGPKCQYMCHCRKGVPCLEDGRCPDDICEKGFFGPACQYYDIAYTPLDWEGFLESYVKHTTTQYYMRDGDDSTCKEIHSRNNLNVYKVVMYFNVSIWFSWLRLVTDSPKEHPHYTIYGTFKDAVPKVVKPIQTYVRSPFVSETYGEFDHVIDALYFLFKPPKVKVCSAYISGGRNVAIKQEVDQSSTMEDYVATFANDGNLDTNFFYTRNCFLTFLRQGQPMPPGEPYWSLIFSRPTAVDRYILLNRKDGYNMCGIRLQAWNKDDELVQWYRDPDQFNGAQLRYEMRFPKASELTRVNVSFQQDNWITGYSPCSMYRSPNRSKFLSICELMAFGDSVCPLGRWGFDCEKTCRCPPNTECYVSAGDACVYRTTVERISEMDEEKAGTVGVLMVTGVLTIVSIFAAVAAVVLYRRGKCPSTSHKVPRTEAEAINVEPDPGEAFDRGANQTEAPNVSQSENLTTSYTPVNESGVDAL